MKPLALAPAALVAAGLAAAAAPAAYGATVGSPDSCVRVISNLPTFRVVADGFAPGAFLTFKADDATVGSGNADGAGHFDNDAARFYPPPLPSGRDLKTFQLTADDGAGLVAGPVPIKVSNVAVRAPANSKPRKRVRFRVFGFRSGEPVYLHVRRKGRTLGRFRMGRTNGACGTLVKRMRFMPLRHYTLGTYKYYFSHSKRFDKDQVIYRATVSIYARPAQATAAAAWD